MINYIIKALLEGDSIFVNDLGTFTKQYQSARFEGDTMLPPQYIVNLTVQDDQLDEAEFINLLCREKQCRITEAAAEISRWVEELKMALENNKSVSFDNFGTFSLNNKGSIQFACDHIDEINREFEGMGVVRLGAMDEEVQEVNEEEEERLAREAEEKRLQEEAEQRLREAEEQERLAKEAEERRLQEEAEQRLREEEERRAREAEEKRLQEEEEQRRREEEERRLHEEAEQRLREAEEQERLAKEAEEKRLLEEAEVQEVKEVNEMQEMKSGDDNTDYDDIPTEGKKKHRSLWWLFVLIILIALGVLGYLFRQQLTDVFNRIKEKITAPKEAVVQEEPETVAEDTIAYDEAIAEDTVSEPEVYTPEVVRNTVNGNYPVIRFEQGHYYVIAGSLPSEQDAVRHIKQRNLDQYDPKLVMQNGVSNLRVCIGIFNTEEEAESFAKNINPHYWVLK